MIVGVILALMALAYLGHWPIQALTGIDATVSYYGLRGLLGAALFWALRDLKPALSWRCLCYAGMLFEFSTFIGSIGYLMDKRMPAMWQGLIDIQTGLPMYWVGVVVLAFIAGAIDYESHPGRE